MEHLENTDKFKDVVFNGIALPPGALFIKTEIVEHPPVKLRPGQNLQTENQPQSFINKVKSFTLAMASAALQPAASRAQRRARLATCAGCNAFKSTGDYRVGFCGACGCGASKLSTLAVKSKILRSSCPRNLWDAAISLPILPPAPPEV